MLGAPNGILGVHRVMLGDRGTLNRGILGVHRALLWILCGILGVSWELEHRMNRDAILVKHSKKSDIRPKPKRLVVDEGENISIICSQKE